MSVSSVPLSTALEAALLRELAAAWDEFNAHHFKRRLRRPQLKLHDGEGKLGQWIGAHRTLSLSRALVKDRPWGVVREVLKHEMAHQFVYEVLGARDEAAHGATFENLCRQLGIDASATGVPPVPSGGEQDNPVLRRIAKLLALAESPNQHEAELAMREAQRLMLKHNIEGAVAAARQGYTFRHVGRSRRRSDGHEHVLGNVLAEHFFVLVIWVPSYEPQHGRSGRVLELCGTPSNLEVATYVHGFLLETAERLWCDHKVTHGIAGDRDRRRFLLGVMIGFEDKLRAGANQSRQEGLIWMGDPGLADFLARRYPRRSGSGSVGVRRDANFEHGRAAGHDIVLHKPVHGSSDRGRFLPPVS